jgi:predicted HNH restriction endonuclease
VQRLYYSASLKANCSLEEGVAVTYNAAADFVVLCADCHQMIHRSADPSNLVLFRENLVPPKT